MPLTGKQIILLYHDHDHDPA
ncbi:hypothetical protein DFAR_570015 [Desulfarculales bacterium]